MKKKTQKDVVFEVIKEVLGDLYSSSENMRPYFGLHPTEKEWAANWGETWPSMEQAIDKLVVKYENKELIINKDFGGHTPPKSYLKNLIFNWLNKDKRLNGGRHYQSFKSSVRYRSYPGNDAHQKNRSIIEEVLADKKLETIFDMIILNKEDPQNFKRVKEMLVSRVLEVATEKYNSRDFIAKKAA